MSFNIHLLQGDITKAPVDVIVNAANQSMLGGGGVDGAIHAAAGEDLMATCAALRACPAYAKGLETGNVAVTPGFNLPAKNVILTVGPIYYDYHTPARVAEGRELLKLCYRSSILAAERLCAKSIAFPSISTGVYAWPLEDAAKAAIEELDNIRELAHKASATHFSWVQDVYFYLFDQTTYDAYYSALNGA